ncbi:hypothetical protein ACTP13_04935 [Paenibacillus peoriae]|uniref:hypothetical protein n=1 Tax=Paenibacillus peoriae TaxID=59893 RepID=UPI003F9D9357
MIKELVIQALDQKNRIQRLSKGALHHSDRVTNQTKLAKYHMKGSVRRRELLRIRLN